MPVADKYEVTYECMKCGERQTLTYVGRGGSTMHSEHGADACNHIPKMVDKQRVE